VAVERRRRTKVAFAVVVGLVVAAGVAMAIPGMTHWVRGTAGMASTASADYVGSSWLLTSVALGADVIAIPAEVGARMDLLADGQILIDDGTNELSGRFTASADGFEVRDVGTTLVAYVGNDTQRLLAIAALNSLAYGNPGGASPPDAIRDTVIDAYGDRLVIQAGRYRLTFERSGPAMEARPDPA
jgi:hypothetical protein